MCVCLHVSGVIVYECTYVRTYVWALPRQAVYNDCSDAWDALNHNILGPFAHKQTGMTLDLEGGEDDDLYRDLKPLWHSSALDMPAARAKVIAEVQADVKNKVITSFSQWPEIMESFPEHSAMFEGQEGLPVRHAGDDDEDDEDEGDDEDGDDGPSGGGKGGAKGSEEEDDEGEDEGEDEDMSDESEDDDMGGGGGKKGGEKPGDEDSTFEPSSRAESEVDVEAAGVVMGAMSSSSAAAASAAAGVTAAAAPPAAPAQAPKSTSEIDILERALAEAKTEGFLNLAQDFTKKIAKAKKERHLRTPLAQHLRDLSDMRHNAEKEEGMKRKEHENAIKAADRGDKRKLLEAQIERDRERRACVVAEREEKARKQKEAQDAKEKLKDAARFQKIIANSVLKKLKQQGAERSLAAKDAIKTACNLQSVRKKGSASVVTFNLPDFYKYEGVEEIQPLVFRRVGTHKDVTGSVIALFASETFEWEICNSKRLYSIPDGGVAVLDNTLGKVCPYYSDVVGQRWPAMQLLKEQDCNLDFAFLAGVWRYSRALGDSFPEGLPNCWPPPPDYLTV